tara:strand:- start:25 stop:588 length:564 start_codon:yes stop_codon:yes gene_type:complete
MTVNYDDPDSKSTNLTYKPGREINDGGSLSRIRETNIDNLEKQYMYIYPRCLDLYKRWKYAELNKYSEASSLEQQYNQCSSQLEILKNKLDEANLVTDEEIQSLKRKTINEDRKIFINQQKIDDSTSTLEKKQEMIQTSNDKVRDYTQLYNSINTQNIIWLILLIIFILGFLGLGYIYFGVEMSQSQ